MAERLTRRGAAPRPRIVHLGPGAFFRAFLAVFTEDAAAASGEDWGILAISLRSTAARDALAPQGGLYTAMALTPEGPRPRVVGTVAGVLVAPEDPAAAVEAMAAPAVVIVSLTVTEKGYCLDPATGRLDAAHPDITHDIAQPARPRSAPGLILAALALRRERGHAPFTVLPCDNLPANGRLMRGVLADLARARDPSLAGWIEAHVPCPSTMVDRITPATTEADRATLREIAGRDDPGLVVHEPFGQWVIEEVFPTGRPAWERAGAQMVRSVGPFETMKLRCLNGTHSALAYLGSLAGHETIAETVADPPFAAFCERLWSDEILPAVPTPEDTDLGVYCAALMARFRNPAIRHRTAQIAMDGSQKLPQRILGTVRDRLDAGAVPEGLCLAVAGWMRHVSGAVERGAPVALRDPLADALRSAVASSETPEGQVAALLGLRAVFGTDLADAPRFREAVTR
ncbi:MAG: mannitol dehydrogenase family protein, partial [Roseicyclus sp.]